MNQQTEYLTSLNMQLRGRKSRERVTIEKTRSSHDKWLVSLSVSKVLCVFYEEVQVCLAPNIRRWFTRASYANRGTAAACNKKIWLRITIFTALVLPAHKYYHSLNVTRWRDADAQSWITSRGNRAECVWQVRSVFLDLARAERIVPIPISNVLSRWLFLLICFWRVN